KIIQIEDRAVALNEYYILHPEMMLGEMRLKGTMYRDKEPTLAGELTELSLRRAIHALVEGVYIPRDQARATVRTTQPTDPEQLNGIKDGGYGIIEGAIVKRLGTR